MNALVKVLERAKSSSDVVLAIVLAAIVGAMIVPLPAWLLDVGIALNLGASVSLLVAALYAKDALKVASFPTLLLLTTLFRLSLNVSSTRLALAEGHAGQIIQAFGEFVVGGDYVVGAVLFIILTLVQFLVVAKGAERVAEVSARFTLDAMPGKQMAIDADLRSGAIDQAEARARRRALERESQMFGSMDGAMKFVKGDVIAGLVIVLVNLVGGTAIGVFQQNLPMSEAASLYALIAIGDGLVSQIPSLCIALGAGLVVTRVSGENEDSSLGAEIGEQFFGQWRALFVVSALCLALSLMPGMPTVIFLMLAAAAAAGGHVLRKRDQAPKAASTPSREENRGEAPAAPPGPLGGAVGVTPLTLELSVGLNGLFSEDQGKALTDELNRAREQLFAELGIRIPGFSIRTHASYLAENSYRFLMDEIPRGVGTLNTSGVYALVPPDELVLFKVRGEAVTDASTGKPLSFVTKEEGAILAASQAMVRSPQQQLVAHLKAILRRHVAKLLGIQEARALLDEFEAVAPTLVREALQKVPLPLLTDVLKKLAEEQVSIRNLKAILEALVSPTTEGDAAALAERCRQALHSYLSHRFAPNGPLYAYLVDPSVEALLREAGKGGAVEPSQVSALLDGVRKMTEEGQVVLLTAPDIRRRMRRLLEGAFPDVAVLTYAELDVDLQIRPIGRLSTG